MIYLTNLSSDINLTIQSYIGAENVVVEFILVL